MGSPTKQLQEPDTVPNENRLGDQTQRHDYAQQVLWALEMAERAIIANRMAVTYTPGSTLAMAFAETFGELPAGAAVSVTMTIYDDGQKERMLLGESHVDTVIRVGPTDPPYHEICIRTVLTTDGTLMPVPKAEDR